MRSSSFKNLKNLTLTLFLSLPICAFAQTENGTSQKVEKRPEVNFSQRHGAAAASGLYADGVKIKKDLDIVDKAQMDRVLGEGEIPADDLYGSIWNNRYVNAYGSLEATPDTFAIDLTNFTIPTTGYVTSKFGPRRRRMHYGIDLKVQVGDTIYAAFDGKVRICRYERRGYGYYVVLRHNNGLETVYGHLSEFLVSEDDVVKSGTPIALGGNTGRSTGAHLHFETRFLGKPINPAEIIDFDSKLCYEDTYKVSGETFSYASSTRNSKYTASKSTKSSSNKYASGSVKYHRVKSGDTLGAIARRYGTSVSKLCKLNNIGAGTTLKLGKSIRVS